MRQPGPRWSRYARSRTSAGTPPNPDPPAKPRGQNPVGQHQIEDDIAVFAIQSNASSWVSHSGRRKESHPLPDFFIRDWLVVVDGARPLDVGLSRTHHQQVPVQEPNLSAFRFIHAGTPCHRRVPWRLPGTRRPPVRGNCQLMHLRWPATGLFPNTEGFPSSGNERRHQPRAVPGPTGHGVAHDRRPGLNRVRETPDATGFDPISLKDRAHSHLRPQFMDILSWCCYVVTTLKERKKPWAISGRC